MAEDIMERDEGNKYLKGLARVPILYLVVFGTIIILGLWINNTLTSTYTLIIMTVIGLLVIIGKSQVTSEHLTYNEVLEMAKTQLIILRKSAEKREIDLPTGKFFLNLGCNAIHDLNDSSRIREWRQGFKILDPEGFPHAYFMKIDPRRIEAGGVGVIGISTMPKGKEYEGDEPIIKPVYIAKKGDLEMYDELDRRHGGGFEEE